MLKNKQMRLNEKERRLIERLRNISKLSSATLTKSRILDVTYNCQSKKGINADFIYLLVDLADCLEID